MPGGEQYFQRAPSSTSKEREIRLHRRGLHRTLVTDRGTFSPDRIDTGTGFLLDEAPEPPAQGTFLDLGCGYGAIAVTLATLYPGATVWAVDVNERARELTQRNAEGLPNVRVAAPDDVPDDVRFDLIWSNPPIRIGKAALHELLARWLTRLTPDGEAILVIGKNLGGDSHHRWLDEHVGPTDRLASKKGYRLLRTVQRPSS